MPANTEERLGYHVDPISGTAGVSVIAAALAVKWEAAQPVVESMAWEIIATIALEEVQAAT